MRINKAVSRLRIRIKMEIIYTEKVRDFENRLKVGKNASKEEGKIYKNKKMRKLRNRIKKL